KIFPGRKHVPKTLIFAKTDSHADDIVQIVREEFNEGNEFCQKITYKTEGIDPEDLISQFRNEFNPRIAVTVDMIATGTNIKPLEIVFFMRSVKSRNYFEQMKGRGVRVMKNDDFKAVTPDAMAKERFVIVDAVRICEIDELNETKPMDKKPLVPFEKLLKALRFGKPKKEIVSSVASRLSRLQKKLTDDQIKEIKKISDGKELSDYANEFVEAIDEDKVFAQAQKEFGEKGEYFEYEPKQKELEEVTAKRIIEAIKPFIGNGRLMQRLPELKQETEQIIDDVSVDEIEEAGYSVVAKDRAKSIIKSFREFIEENKDELTAIQAFYHNGKLSWNSIKELADKIKTPPYNLTPSKLWQAYHQIDDGKVHGRSIGKISDFVSILRFELGNTSELEPFNDTVDKRFAVWLS
ncbi:MAG: type I restriction-modification enzyme R subunit C-terminal domain-containing protein, partial [Nitrosarchaeum sp.]|nr:type I restriction-modification enzyme R subunit C-terminal domain-containing protein [Nitrosarchaeum sp.]